jgi:hypothetical protein
MNWEALGAIGEMVGGIAVIVTLVYLATQIRQNNALARATAQRDLSDSYQSSLHQLSEHPELMRRGMHDFESLSKSEQLTFAVGAGRLLNHLDQTLRMYRQGLQTEDLVQGYGDICLSLLSTPGGRACWEMMKGMFVREGREYIEKRFENPSTMPPPLTVLPFFAQDDAEPTEPDRP